MRTTAIGLLGSVYLACQALAQQTWKVNCAGDYGAHFLDIPQALAAASPGDTILVYSTVSGCPALYTAPLIDKAVSIVGCYVGQQPGGNQPSQAFIAGPIVISDIAAGSRLLLSNITVLHSMWGSAPRNGQIVVRDCSGSVVIEDLWFRNYGTLGQILRFERCGHVVLRGCRFEVGGAPICFEDSHVLFSNSIAEYKPPLPPLLNGWTTPTETMNVLRSSVTLVGSSVEGYGYSGNYPAQPAAIMDSSTMRVGATSLFRGGAYVNPLGYWWDYTQPAWFVGGPSVVEKDPRSPMTNYFPAHLPIITPIDETYHDWIVADENYNVRVAGPSGGFAALCVSSMLYPTPSPLGTLGIDPFAAQVVDFVALPQPDGIYNWTFFCPSTVPSGFAFAFQSLTLSPTGVFGLTEPSPLTVAWEKSRIP